MSVRRRVVKNSKGACVASFDHFQCLAAGGSWRTYSSRSFETISSGTIPIEAGLDIE